MRIIILFFVCLGLLSCGPQQKRNADLVVTYNNKTIYSVGPSWNTEADLLEALSTGKRPIRIVFSAPWCPHCKKLKKIIEKQDWREHVYYLNLDEDWVKELALITGVNVLPSMVVFDGKNGENSAKFVGWGSIAMALLEQIEKK
jgi:thioredoxin-like negative regulator of GroEL